MPVKSDFVFRYFKRNDLVTKIEILHENTILIKLIKE